MKAKNTVILAAGRRLIMRLAAWLEDPRDADAKWAKLAFNWALGAGNWAGQRRGKWKEACMTGGSHGGLTDWSVVHYSTHMQSSLPPANNFLSTATCICTRVICPFLTSHAGHSTAVASPTPQTTPSPRGTVRQQRTHPLTTVRHRNAVSVLDIHEALESQVLGSLRCSPLRVVLFRARHAAPQLQPPALHRQT
jgi:hypothetical protein